MNRFLLFAILLTAVFDASAQKVQRQTTVEQTEDGRVETTVTTDKYKVETNYFWDNWFISAGFGAQYFLGDNEKYMRFKDRLTPAIDASVGKWFSPGIGVQLSYTGYKFKGLYTNALLYQNFRTDHDKLYSNPKDYNGAEGRLYEQKGSFVNLHAEALFNLSNIFGGYKERVYSCIPYVGVGWIRSYSDGAGKYQKGISKSVNGASFNAGIINSFRVTRYLNINLTIRGAVVPDDFDGEVSGKNPTDPDVVGSGNLDNWGKGQNHNADAYLGMTLGVTYRFKQRGWDKARSVKTIHTNEKEIARLTNRISQLQAENEEMKNKPAPVPVVIKETDVVTFPYLVNFVIDKVKVVNRERVNLGFVAAMMKSLPDQKFRISGFADRYTGSVERNIWLGENRAKNVFKVLTEEFGVPAEQLVVDHHGGVANMYYDDPQLSRSVLIDKVE
ncbi:OmpA family protein [uncultured Alistipes sp.]|jgi:putative outer membrane protein|uniref:OmpA family protein n=1 Tax=uncultured Alistipes sp. TaxID=538949 RepID=UPI0025F090C7|nr:OmpA family protein [uncultured Alistipes sp.]